MKTSNYFSSKLFALTLALVASVSSFAYKFQYGNLYYEKLSSNTAEVCGYIGEPTSVTIPTIVKDMTYGGEYKYTVTDIAEKAFFDCSSLTSITISDSVTNIRDLAFSGCSSLSSVTIPKSVTYIGNNVFSRCPKLTSIVVDKDNEVYDSRDNCNAIIRTFFDRLDYGCCRTVIPNSVTRNVIYAFYGCSSLTSVTIPNSVTSIGWYAFYGCSSLTSIAIPSSVKSIEEYTFYGCSSLTSVTIPNSVTSIGNCAFSGCSGLTFITIPNSVTSIGEGAFSHCSSLTSVTIPNSVKGIGYWAFSQCKSLKSVTIGNGLTTIGNLAFKGCKALTSVTIGNGLTSIGDLAFEGCSSLYRVVCEAVLVPTTGSDVFKEVPISSAVLYVPDEAVDIYIYMKPWSEFSMILPISQLPSGVENVQTSIIDASKTKIIRDGQVVILHNDKSYNVMGQEL